MNISTAIVRKVLRSTDPEILDLGHEDDLVAEMEMEERKRRQRMHANRPHGRMVKPASKRSKRSVSPRKQQIDNALRAAAAKAGIVLPD